MPAAQVRAKRDVLQHAHAWQQAHVLEGAAHAHAGNGTRTAAIDALAEKADFTRSGRIDAGDQVEQRRLARPVGANQRQNLAARHAETHPVVRHETAELLDRILDLQERRPGRRHRTRRQGLRGKLGAGGAARGRREPARQPGPQPLARPMQHEDHQQSEADHLEVAGGAEQLRQQILQPLLEHGDHRGAEQRAPDVGGAADHRHEQVFDADVQAEGRRIDEALEVGVKPAGKAGEQGGDQEDDHLGAAGVDAHRLGHQRTALECADRAAGTRVEQVAGQPHRGEQHHPDQVVEMAAVAQLETAEAQWRYAADAGMAAEELEVAEQEIQRDAPGDRAERQIVPRQAQGEQAEQQGDQRGQQQPREQAAPRVGQRRQPSRQGCRRGQRRGRIGAQTDESRLAEGGQPADAGQQHQTERHQRVEADVIEQRDVELGQDERTKRQQR